jgi:hypothetical protein
MRSVTIQLTHRAPTQIIAGDSIEFLVAVPTDYQAWTGSARLTGPGQMAATSCVLEGSDFHLKFEGQGASGTKTLTAGQYVLTVWATSGNDRRTIAQFPLSIAPDLSTGSPALDHAVKMLTLINTAIENRIAGNNDGGIEDYTVDGTQVRKLPMLELQKLRNKYSAEVAALQNPNGQLRRVNFAFAPTGGMIDVRKRFG